MSLGYVVPAFAGSGATDGVQVFPEPVSTRGKVFSASSTYPTATQNEVDEHDVLKRVADTGACPSGNEAGNGAGLGVQVVVVVVRGAAPCRAAAAGCTATNAPRPSSVAEATTARRYTDARGIRPVPFPRVPNCCCCRSPRHSRFHLRKRRRDWKSPERRGRHSTSRRHRLEAAPYSHSKCPRTMPR